MRNFTSIEILPCNSRSIVQLLAVFTIYQSKRHSYSEKIDIVHFHLSFLGIKSTNHLGFCRKDFILRNYFHINFNEFSP